MCKNEKLTVYVDKMQIIHAKEYFLVTCIYSKRSASINRSFLIFEYSICDLCDWCDSGGLRCEKWQFKPYCVFVLTRLSLSLPLSSSLIKRHVH